MTNGAQPPRTKRQSAAVDAAGAAAPEEGPWTQDAFLGGRLSVRQPAKGFRAGLDSVLLASAVRAQPGDRIAELGMGAGVASLCLAVRVPALSVTGFEADPALVALARANVRANGLENQVDARQADVTRTLDGVAPGTFDHVFFNPPFLDASRATAGPDPGKAQAIAQDPGAAPLWFKTARRLLKPKGELTLIHRADALPEILANLAKGFGGVETLAVYAQAGRAAIRVIVRARKGARGPHALLPGLLLHGEGQAFTAQALAILRAGASLSTSRA
jgi:tRNA1(Val) A37 N6-methylase TrmN6